MLRLEPEPSCGPSAQCDGALERRSRGSRYGTYGLPPPPPSHPPDSIRQRMTAYDTAAWAPAFTAIAGSSAALTGLLFVAISINLGPIIKGPALVPRAVEVLVLLTAVLVMSTLLLMPAMAAGGVGVEVLSITLIAEVFVTLIQVRSVGRLPRTVGPRNFALRVFGGQVGLILLLIGGVSLVAQSGGGLYWVVPGMAFAMVSAIIGAWILLVEIVR